MMLEFVQCQLDQIFWKQIKNTNPFDNQMLDAEEQALEDALERGEFESVGNFEATKEMLQEAATRYLELNTTKPG